MCYVDSHGGNLCVPRCSADGGGRNSLCPMLTVMVATSVSHVAVLTVAIGTRLQAASTPDYVTYIVAAFGAWHVLTHFLLELNKGLERNDPSERDVYLPSGTHPVQSIFWRPPFPVELIKSTLSITSSLPTLTSLIHDSNPFFSPPLPSATRSSLTSLTHLFRSHVSLFQFYVSHLANIVSLTSLIPLMCGSQGVKTQQSTCFCHATSFQSVCAITITNFKNKCLVAFHLEN